jgi:hypothetical protein
MITVPRRDQGGVPTAPLPGARVSPNAPTSAFQPPAPVDVSGVTRVVAQLAEKERAKADQLALLDADNQLAQLQADLSVQATNRRGKDALGAEADTTDAWKQGVDKIRGNLTNERQQLAFEGRVSGRGQSLYETVARHTQSEVQQYDKETTLAALDIRLNDAIKNYQDPAQVGQALGETKAILTDFGRRNGWAPEVVADKVASQVSKMHSGVIEAMLAKGDDLAASKYYETAKPEIVGTDSVQVVKSLEEGSVRGESQRQADEIVAQQGATRTSALEAAKKITDPKVRDATENRINQHFSEQNAAQQERREKDMLTATDIVEKTGSVYRIPPALWTTFTLGEREALKNYGKVMAKGETVVTNWATYYDLQSIASSDATRDRFLRTNLLQYRGQLGDTEFKQLVELQASMRKGDNSADATLGGIRTTQQVVDASLTAAGIDPTPKPDNNPNSDAGRVSRFRRQVDQETAQLEAQTKKKPSAVDVQQIVDNLLVRGIVRGKLWGIFDTVDEKRQFERVPGESGFVVDVKDVPYAERRQIEDALRRRQQPVTDANVLRLYQQQLAKMVSNGRQ